MLPDEFKYVEFSSKIYLLEESFSMENLKDVFTRFDGKVQEALFNMGIESEENVKAVTAAVNHKIAQHAPNWNNLIHLGEKHRFSSQINSFQRSKFGYCYCYCKCLELFIKSLSTMLFYLHNPEGRRLYRHKNGTYMVIIDRTGTI